ncbi:MAG: DNA mismatch repair endonuclease MutL [Promethearchaeota archaeon]
MIRRKITKIIDAQKIAAGEVVERPANIVKELVENSIDAEADEIRIIVKKAGKESIQVIDNGIGISPEDMEIAFERHTSSKIRSIEDLENLTTLGFRGEALASIAAVSKIEITSRTEQNEKGIQLQIEGGTIKNKKDVSCQIGTNIKIRHLFFNIPARQKFLKKDATELGHITDIVQRYSLAFPELHFVYRHNEIDILNCPSKNDLKTTVFHIYGKNNAKFMESIDFKDPNSVVQVHGLLGHPQIAKKSRNYSSLFINDRYVINDVIFRSIIEAYEGTLMVSRYPFFILFLEIDPSLVDFNVHPKKLEVRFENEEALCNRIYNIIRKFIEEKFIEKEAKYLNTELEDFLPRIREEQREIDKTSRIRQDIKDSTENNSVTLSKSNLSIEEGVQLNLLDEKVKHGEYSETYLRRKYTISKDFPKLRLISSTGQLANKTYVVLEGINENDEVGIFILDQHAASERIKKEKLLATFETKSPMKQKLIHPLKIDTTPSERLFLEGNLKEIKKLGFDFDFFGGNTFILREIPTIMNKVPDTSIIKEIISDITDIGKDKSFKEVKEEIINYIACHKSIRGGDDLSLNDIRKLLDELAECKDSYHCAHGRPTLRFISFKELDKLFKRIV